MVTPPFKKPVLLNHCGPRYYKCPFVKIHTADYEIFNFKKFVVETLLQILEEAFLKITSFFEVVF